MSSVDKRIVEMEFKNASFENGVRQSMSTLERLKNALKLGGASKGLEDIDKASKNFSLDNITKGVESASLKFSALGAIGFTVLQNLTTSALELGGKMVNAITRPILEGGKTRALNIEQAKFQFKGLGMDVEATMASANKAVEGTAYGLDAAAKVAGQLGASGMRAGDDMTSALRGISGLAAMTGSSYEDIGEIFTTVAGNGRLMSNELLRLSSRGVNAAAVLAKHFGVTEAEMRDMVTKGKVSFEDFYQAMDKAFGEHATSANETYTGSLSNLRSALSRIGADIQTPRLEAMRIVINGLIPVINGVRKALSPMSEMLGNQMIAGAEKFVAFLDRTRASMSIFGDVIKNIMKFLERFKATIGTGFKDVFPSVDNSMISNLESFMSKLRDLSASLLYSGETAGKLRRVFAGIFAVFSIVGKAVSALFQIFGKLLGVLTPFRGSMLDIAAGLGDWLVALNETITASNIFGRAIEGVGNFAAKAAGVLQNFIGSVREMFKLLMDANADQLGGIFEDIGEHVNPLEVAGMIIGTTFRNIGRAFTSAFPVVAQAGKVILEHFEKIRDGFSNFIRNLEFDKIGDVINIGLITTIGLGIKKFVDSLTGVVESGGGVLDGIRGILDGVTGSLEAMQQNLKANVLLKIAGAIAILAVALLLLSTIDPNKLTSALAGMGVLFAQLGLFMKALQAMMADTKGFAKLPIMATSILILAGALVLLAVAVKILSSIDLPQLATGLLAIGVLLVELSLFINSLDARKMTVIGSSLLALGAGLIVLSVAVERFGNMDWLVLVKGLLSVGVALFIFSKFASSMQNMKGIVSTAIGIGILAAALIVLSVAIERMGSMDWETIGRGLATIAASLIILSIAMNNLPKNTPAIAFGLLLVSTAMVILAQALKMMGSQGWEEMAKGMITLAGALLIIGVAVRAMQNSLSGAAAIFVVAASLAILAPVLKMFGEMSWGEIARGMVMLAGTFIIFGVAGALLGSVVVVLIGVAAAIALFGLGILAAGVGIAAFATGIVALAAAVTSGGAAIVLALTMLLSLIPLAMEQLALGIIAFAQTIATGGPAIIAALTTILLAMIAAIVAVTPEAINAMIVILLGLLEAINTVSPDIVLTMLNLLNLLLAALVNAIPAMTNAGMDIILGILRGIRNRIGEMTTVAGDIIVRFINGISQQLPRITRAGVELIVEFVEGLASAIRDNQARMNTAGSDLAVAIIDGMTGGLVSGVGRVVAAARDLANSAIQAAKDALSSSSPSKKFWNLGMDSAIGQELGMLAGVKRVSKAGETLAEAGIVAFDAAIRKISSETFVVDYNPVIRPILDLSDVQKGYDSLDSIISPSVGLDLTRDLDHVARANAHFASREPINTVLNKVEDPSSNLTFVQNNYSPKALSRIDIYRQTRNQLTFAKEVINK